MILISLQQEGINIKISSVKALRDGHGLFYVSLYKGDDDRRPRTHQWVYTNMEIALFVEDVIAHRLQYKAQYYLNDLRTKLDKWGQLRQAKLFNPMEKWTIYWPSGEKKFVNIPHWRKLLFKHGPRNPFSEENAIFD